MSEDKSFRIEIEEPEKLYEHFTQHSGQYPLGSEVLTEPFDFINGEAISNGDSYSSLTQLAQSGIGMSDIVDPRKRRKLKCIPLPVKTLENRFKIKHIRNTVYILDEEGKPEYGIISEISGMKIIFGNGPTPSRKIGTLDEFIAGLKRYKDVIETTVNGVYVESGKESPDIVMYWRPAMIMGPRVDQTRNLKEKLLEGLKDKIVVEEKPDIAFEDIGGLEKAKRVIQGLSFALKNPELYKRWGTHPPKGVLLHGPPGTGKTLMAKALAREADANFYHVKVSDITSKWYGESEGLMQSVFDLARKSGKTIIFFDEIDALVPLRAYSHEATGRIVSTMLENLDGLGASEDVMVVGSTNMLEAVDPALLRPGRIDRLVEVGLPEKKGREQIFKIHKSKAEGVAGRELFSELDYKTLLKKTDDYSGADIAEIVRRVLEEKVRQEGSSGKEAGLVDTKDLVKEIENYERTKQVKDTMGFHVKREE